LLGFTSDEVGLMTFKTWFKLYKHYQEFHNFKTKQGLFKIQRSWEELLERTERSGGLLGKNGKNID
jgi:hypothetical protein